jgi:hypothetical protein
VPALAPDTKIKTKRRCCKAGPRCKRCPAVWKKLENAGYADRQDRRHYVVVLPVPKKALKAARAR